MSSTRKVVIPLNFGINSTIDKKLAPFGWLKSAKNVRLNSFNKLEVRNGYQPLTMATANGTLVAHDIFEYQTRLCAIGTDTGDGAPTDIYEFIESRNLWRGTDSITQRPVLNPFTNVREVAGIPQAGAGISALDAVIGDGYVCMAYKIDDSGRVYVIIVDQSNNQAIHQEDLVSSGGVFSAGGIDRFRLAYSSGIFYIGAVFANTNTIKIGRFTPGLSSRFATYSTPDAVGGAAITAFDMVAITNGSTGRIAIAWDRTGADLIVQLWQPNGSRLLGDIPIAGTTTVHLCLEADEIHDTINLYTVETATDGRLRTFDFTGATLTGPTTVTSGATGMLCRLPAASGFAESVGLAVNTPFDGIQIQILTISTHAQTQVQTISNALLTTRLVSGQSPNQDNAVIFGAIHAPRLPTIDQATNVLYYVCPGSGGVAHNVPKDYLRALGPGITGLSAEGGTICWPTLVDPGVDSLGVPSIALVDFRSTNRRQSVEFGEHYYFSGATPSIYDGRFGAELGFAEAPGIVSLTPSNNIGSLTPGATYFYAVHWEMTHADQSLMLSPPSIGGDGIEVTQKAASVTLGPSDNTVQLVVTTPHTVRVAAGDALFGADISCVVSRTEWDPNIPGPRSTLRRCVVKRTPIGMTNYGDRLAITDTISDVVLGSQEPIYTQGSRGVLSGPLEMNAPKSSNFITATESRLFNGGLSRRAQFQISRDAFLSESFHYSDFSPFQGKVSAPIVGVSSLDSAKLAFTSRKIFAIFGDGPDDLGGGALNPPIEITSPGGLRADGFRSFLRVPEGLFFQLDDNKLMLLPRGAGSPVWTGEPISEVLESFPAISGACRVSIDHGAAFACTTAIDARIAFADFTHGQWFIDNPPLQTTKGIESIVEYGGKIAYLSGGVVYGQSSDFADIATTFIDTEIVTNPIYPWGVGGHGSIDRFLYTGERRSASNLIISMSYDDGLTWEPMITVAETGTVGATIQHIFSTDRKIMDRVSFKIAVTGVTAGEGLIHNEITLLVTDAAPDFPKTAAQHTNAP